MDKTQAQQTINDINSGKITWDDNLRAQANNALSGGGGGGGIDTASYDELLKKLPSTMEFIKTTEAPINETLNQLVLAMRGRKDPLQVFTEMEEAIGLPGQRRVASSLREQVYSLEDAIRAVEPTIAGTTRESLVTQSQREKMIQAGKKPLYENLARFTTDLGRIGESISAMERTLGTKTELYLKGQEMQLEPLQVQLSYLQDRAARLLTGFTSDKQTYLDVTLSKIRRGEQLSDIERSESFQLLQDEKNYQQTVSNMKLQSQINIDEYKQQKEIDQRYKTGGVAAGDSAEDILSILKTAREENQPKNFLSSPPMSSPAGTVAEYPPGSGVYWTSGGNSQWF